MTKPKNGMCAQQRLRSAWASTQSDQSLHCRMKKAWILSYPLSAQQFESSLGAHFVGFVMLWLIGLFVLCVVYVTFNNHIATVSGGGRELNARCHKDLLTVFNKLLLIYTHK